MIRSERDVIGVIAMILLLLVCDPRFLFIDIDIELLAPPRLFERIIVRESDV